MFSDGLTGSGIHDPSVRFRMYLIFTVAIFAFGSVMYWRSQALLASEFVEFPNHKPTKQAQAGSKNFQIEYLDESINVK